VSPPSLIESIIHHLIITIMEARIMVTGNLTEDAHEYTKDGQTKYVGANTKDTVSFYTAFCMDYLINV